MKLNSTKSITGIFGIFLGLWLVVSWIVADNKTIADIRELSQDTQQDLDVKAEYLASILKSRIEHLSNVPQLVGKEQNVLKALAQAATGKKSRPNLPAKNKQYWSDIPLFKSTNIYLANLAKYTDAGVIYVMNSEGDCVLSSNADKQDSFVGANFSTRNYFKEAAYGRDGYQYAMGKVSNLPGLYFSSPIVRDGKLFGVGVVKINLGDLSPWINQANAYLTDEYGVVILAYDKQLEMKSLSDSRINVLTKENRLQRYKRADLPSLGILQWPNLGLAGIHHFDHEKLPILISSKPVQKELDVHVTKSLEQVTVYATKRLELFALLALFGLLVTSLIIWRLYVIRTREHVDEEISKSETRLKNAQHIARVGSFEWYPDSGELIWSDEHYRLLGLEPKCVIPGMELFQQCMHPDDLLKMEAALQQAVSGKKNYDCEHRIIWPDGSVHHVHGRGEVMFDATGHALRMSGTLQDVSDSKRAEESLITAKKQADDAVRMLSTVLDTIPVRIFWKDLNLNYLGCNQLFAQDAGKVSPRELIGKDDYAMNWHQSADLYRSDDSKIIERGLPKLNYEEPQIRADGTTVWLRTSKVPLRTSKGEVIGILGTYEDITSRKQIERSLIEARDDAERANQAKSEFLSNMSHELRTPLNAVLGFTQIMQCDDALPAEHKQHLTEILKAGKHLLLLINDILDLAKIESGRIDLSIEPIEAGPVIEESLSMVSTLALKRGIQINSTGELHRMLRADRARLKQALLNILTNAIKYNRDNGSITLDVLQSGEDRVRIRITDTGIGIAPERIKELFHPFNRLGFENSGIEGTGIGLSITRRIIETMGGSIAVTSEVGIGSSFWVELPANSHAGNEQDLAVLSNDDVISMHDIKLNQYLVLYIEDNPANLRLVAQMLAQRKHITLLTAHTPELGIELARERHPALILLDINMPVLDGYQVLKIFQADPNLKDIPVIAVTANAMPRDIERGMRAGFTDYLTKPLDLMRFKSILDKYLRHVGQGKNENHDNK